MGRGRTRETLRSAGLTWAPDDLSAAAAFGGAQLRAAGLLWWLWPAAPRTTTGPGWAGHRPPSSRG